MAEKIQTTRGPQTQVINRRTQLGAFEWKGMAPDVDPGTLAENRPALLMNVRLHGDGIAPRGGSARLIALGGGAVGGIVGLFDFQLATAKKMWVVGDGCPGLSSSIGYYVGFYDVEQDPPFQPGIYYNSSTGKVVLGTYEGDLYVGVDNVLRKVTLIDAPYGGDALAVSGSSQDIALLTETGFTKITDLCEFDGKLFFSVDGGAGASKIGVWDGLTENVDLASINAPTALTTYRESLIAGFAAAGPNAIRVRPVGVPGTAWATVTPGAGTAIMRGPGCAATYKDVLWFATGAQTLCSYNGTTLTVVDVATTGIAANSVTHSCCVFNGYLFVTYTTSTNRARIARFDGTTWVPIHKDITTQFSYLTAIRSISEYRGDLWIGATGASGGHYVRSPGTATTGTWVSILPSATYNGDVDQILVY